MNRRHLIRSAAGVGLAVAGLAEPPRGLAALTATDDELAYANFGLATELLLQDFHAKTAAAKVIRGSAAREFARSSLNASQHADALSMLLIGAGQTAAVAEDFSFSWPGGSFANPNSVSAAGLTVARPLLGVYMSAAAAISIPSYRTLFASMAANVAQQVSALSLLSGGRAVGISFPSAIDVETASDAIEAYLG